MLDPFLFIVRHHLLSWNLSSFNTVTHLIWDCPLKPTNRIRCVTIPFRNNMNVGRKIPLTGRITPDQINLEWARVCRDGIAESPRQFEKDGRADTREDGGRQRGHRTENICLPVRIAFAELSLLQARTWWTGFFFFDTDRFSPGVTGWCNPKNGTVSAFASVQSGELNWSRSVWIAA